MNVVRKIVFAGAACVVLAAAYWWSYATFWMSVPRYRWEFDHWMVRQFGDELDHRMVSLTARGAVDCGRARIRGFPDASGATDCVLAASREARGFRVRYDYPPARLGADAAYALVGTPDGRAFALFFRAEPSQKYLGGKYQQNVDLRSCPQPTTIRVEHHMATCFPPHEGGELE